MVSPVKGATQRASWSDRVFCAARSNSNCSDACANTGREDQEQQRRCAEPFSRKYGDGSRKERRVKIEYR